MAMLQYSQKTQNFSVTGMDAGRLHSQTFFEVALWVGQEHIKMPVQTCTKISELKEVVASQMGYLDPADIGFVVKQGCTYKKMLDTDEVVHKMFVKGIKSWKVPRHKYPHPYGIIGGGYNGIKTALMLKKFGSEDFFLFDRYDKVGGHTWLEMANKTTKLQTEFPTYHIWYGPEFSMPGIKECGGAPVDWEIWPKQEQIVEHFEYCAQEYNLYAHAYMETNVENMEMIGKISDRDRHYNLIVCPVKMERRAVQGGGALAHQLGGDASKHQHGGNRDSSREPFQVSVSCLCMWPGALVYPRPVVWKGEDLFGGAIDYAVERRFDYSHVPGKVVCIVGHGAFTMENIRTCLEEAAKKIWVLCRKMNLTCPRPCSWFVNQSNPPISAAQMLDMLSIGYKHLNFDPWTMHSVHGNSARTHATIIQKTRFGIGDVYFLTAAYGLMEVVVSDVKRVTFHTLHLENGEKIDCDVVLKCTGCLADWKVDKLLKIKEMRGMYVNGDIRRVCSGEADGINAAQFGGTTGGPGIYGMVKEIIHFWDVPNDWHRLLDLGILDQLPVHKAGEPNEEFPAYFFTASHGQSAGIVLGAASPLLQQKTANDGTYKNYIQMLCIPTERIISEAKKDWDYYEKKIRDDGLVPRDAPYIPYPYSIEYMEKQFEVHGNYIKKSGGVEAEAGVPRGGRCLPRLGMCIRQASPRVPGRAAPPRPTPPGGGTPLPTHAPIPGPRP
eukprot:CAMPEP_0179231448 /NCGR_PEP_ID=MMETSP0797-20121207/11349_1 /TAXON_ID=47934 /ORGANISM="Dinophysis acuminata, Strain DAEP01" /LENGTH=721 /DNA_ID=CAMNT_0020938537 /DNA_START=60 /DNA_END=2223 /DNA_ORIENTATION=+